MIVSQANWFDYRSVQYSVLLPVFFWLLTLATSRVVAQDLLLDADEAEVEEELLIDDGFEIAPSNFEQWVFGSQNSQQGIQRIESQLTLEVDAINRVCSLTDSQVAKLQLAGQGDLKRFLDEVEVVRKKFMKVRRNRNAFNDIWQDIQPLQTKMNAGLFGDSSFFRKVVSRTLSDEQSSEYAEAEWKRRRFRYHARLALVVTMMESTMPLRGDQREKFIRVLKDETEPPKSFGQYDYYVVLYQLAKIPDEKLQPIFDEAQWKVLKQHVVQARGMEAWLKQQGVLP